MLSKELLRQHMEKASSKEYALSPSLKEIPISSPALLRRVVKEVCISVGSPRYLEVGTYFGGSFAAALTSVDNTGDGVFVAIDNLLEYQGMDIEIANEDGDKVVTEIRDVLQRHAIASWLVIYGKGNGLFYEQDALKVDPLFIREKLWGQGANVFLYDGDHSSNGTYRGIIHFAPTLSDQSILIVDDFDKEDIQIGVKEALRELGHHVEDELLIDSVRDEPLSGHAAMYAIYVALLQKDK